MRGGLLGWAALALVLIPAGDARAGEAEAIEALKKVDALVERDKKRKGEPVVRVQLMGPTVTDADMAHLKEFPELEDLVILATGITDKGLAHVKGLTKLRRLDLSYNEKVTDKGLAHMKGLTKLETLNLIVTGVGDAGLKHLKGLKRLKTLSLSKTDVTDKGLPHLKKLPNLRQLWLVRTKVTKEGVADFQKARPKCAISHP